MNIALEIAKEHLEKANPSMWDGYGNKHQLCVG